MFIWEWYSHKPFLFSSFYSFGFYIFYDTYLFLSSENKGRYFLQIIHSKDFNGIVLLSEFKLQCVRGKEIFANYLSCKVGIFMPFLLQIMNLSFRKVKWLNQSQCNKWMAEPACLLNIMILFIYFFWFVCFIEVKFFNITLTILKWTIQ